LRITDLPLSQVAPTSGQHACLQARGVGPPGAQRRSRACFGAYARAPPCGGIRSMSVTTQADQIRPCWAPPGAAHTPPYDATITGDYLRGRPLPADRWSSLTAPALVMAGGTSRALVDRSSARRADSRSVCWRLPAW